MNREQTVVALPSRPRARNTSRARAYLDACASLGLDPSTRPLRVRKRGGVDAFVVTARAADELAARRGVTRSMLRGPALITDGRTRMAFAECSARTPDGVEARGIAVIPLAQPDTALMSVETQARALATLRVLGLESMAESPREIVPPGFTIIDVVNVPTRDEHARDVAMPTVAMQPVAMPAVPMREVPMATVFSPDGPGTMPSTCAMVTVQEPARVAPRSELSTTMARFLAAVARLARRDDAVGLWLEHRGAVARLDAEDRRAAWGLLCDKVARLGAGADARVWLKRAVEAHRPA